MLFGNFNLKLKNKFTIILEGNIIHMNNAFGKLGGVRGPLYLY